jgi:hypothetical protein
MIRQPLIARAIQPQTRTIDMRMPGRGRGGTSPSFSGIVYLAGRRYYDPALSTIAIGQQISDNSTDAAKTWVVVDLELNTVSYENGPPPFDSDGRMPPSQEWYETAKTFGDIHVTRFG